jgi:hypothetical protein
LGKVVLLVLLPWIYLLIHPYASLIPVSDVEMCKRLLAWEKELGEGKRWYVITIDIDK